MHAAVAVGGDPQAHAREHGRVLRQRRQIFVAHDRRRYVPGRIDRDELHRLGDLRRRGRGLADNDTGLPDLLAVVHHAQHVVRNVERDVSVTEIARRPAPALHIRDDGLDHVGAARRGNGVEAADGGVPDDAVGVHAVLLLVRLHRGSEGLVIAQAGLVACHLEPLAEQRDARVFRARPQRRAFRNAHDLRSLRQSDRAAPRAWP